MNRNRLNLLIDSAAAILLIAMIATGYVLRFPLPPGSHRTHELWGVSRHGWGEIHSWVSLALLAVVAVHVGLHWRWLVIGLLRRLAVVDPAPIAARAGLGMLAVVLAAVVAFAWATHAGVHELARPRHELSPSGGEAGEPLVAARSGVATASPRAAEPDVEAAADRVLRERCARCHGAANPAGGVVADGIVALRRPQAGTAWVVPGKPEASPLFSVVAEPGAAPRRALRHQLGAEEIETLHAWVAGLAAD